METRAHHVIIGLFAVLISAGCLLLVLWLSHAGNNQQFSNYDVVFTEAVSGLSKGSAVQYSGIQVGEVTRLQLDKTDPSRVWARIRVMADTPVKKDTQASLAFTGITGTSIIQLSRGTTDSPTLETSDDHVGVIIATPSPLSKLLNNGEDLLTNINDVVSRLDELLSQKNAEHINNTLSNLDKLTATLAAQDQALQTTMQNAAQASQQLNVLVTAANKKSGALFDKANSTLNAMERGSLAVESLIKDNDSSLNNGFQSLNEIGPALRELRNTLRMLNSIGKNLEEDPAGYLLNGEKREEYTPK